MTADAHACAHTAGTPAEPLRNVQDPGSGAVARSPAASDPAQPPAPPFGANRPAPPDAHTPDGANEAGPRAAGADAAPAGPALTPRSPSAGSSPHASTLPPRRRLSWAALLLRTLDVDALTCARCATPMVVLAFLTDPRVVRRILTHLGMPAAAPSLAKAFQAAPPVDDLLAWSDDAACNQTLDDATGAPAGRAPP